MTPDTRMSEVLRQNLVEERAVRLMNWKKPVLTIVYLTNRTDPRFRWFFDSLNRETGGNYDGIKVVMVDYHYGTGLRTRQRIDGLEHEDGGWKMPPWLVHCPPKPTVWQGPYRLTSQDYFAASNARNTGLLYAEDGYIVHVDDLSVLMPGWLKAVRDAMAANYVVLGAYKKMKNLIVKNGEVVVFEDFEPGVDKRWSSGVPGRAVPLGGDRLYGCSFGAPVEAMLQVNGSDEDCDSSGGEDYVLGIMLEHQGWKLMYDRRMLTYESEEAHSEDKPFRRLFKQMKPEMPGFPDSSHVMLHWARTIRRRAPNYFGEGGIRALRQHVLAGGAFPTYQIPCHDWRDRQALTEM